MIVIRSLSSTVTMSLPTEKIILMMSSPIDTPSVGLIKTVFEILSETDAESSSGIIGMILSSSTIETESNNDIILVAANSSSIVT